MRIGIDARLSGYTQGGIAQYTQHLIQALAHIDFTNQYLILQHRKDHRRLVNRANFARIPMWAPCHHPLEQWFLRFEIPRLKLDVLHSPDFIPPLKVSGKTKMIITIHDLAFLLYPHFLTRDSASYYGQIDRAVRRADHIIAVSKATKRDIIRLLGVPEQRITVIYEAADSRFVPIDDPLALQTVRDRYGLPKRFFLFVSTLEPRKNVPTLLQAFRQLLDDYKVDAHLAIAGRRGWLFDEIDRKVAELKLERYVHFLGRVPSADLPFLYNAAVALVHPSYYEGFGLPPLEAMACGTPVIVSNVSALPEVVGDAALMVSPDDVDGLTVAMWRILTDEALRADLIDKGFRRAACFSWEKAAQETLDLYQRVAQS